MIDENRLSLPKMHRMSSIPHFINREKMGYYHLIIIMVFTDSVITESVNTIYNYPNEMKGLGMNYDN